MGEFEVAIRVAGREPAKLAPAISASSLTFESARALGNVWTLTEIWKELGISDAPWRRCAPPLWHTTSPLKVGASIPLFTQNFLHPHRFWCPCANGLTIVQNILETSAGDDMARLIHDVPVVAPIQFVKQFGMVGITFANFRGRGSPD